MPTNIEPVLRSPLTDYNTKTVKSDSFEFIMECVEPINTDKGKQAAKSLDECSSCFITGENQSAKYKYMFLCRARGCNILVFK